MRFKRFAAIAIERELVGRQRRPEIFGVERTVRIDRLGVAHGDGCRQPAPRRREPDVTDEVLAEINNPGVAVAGDFLRSQFHQRAHRRAELRDERDGMFLDDGVCPNGIVEGRLVPILDGSSARQSISPHCSSEPMISPGPAFHESSVAMTSVEPSA